MWPASFDSSLERRKRERRARPHVKIPGSEQIVTLGPNLIEASADQRRKLESFPHILAPIETLESRRLDVADITHAGQRVDADALVSPVTIDQCGNRISLKAAAGQHHRWKILWHLVLVRDRSSEQRESSTRRSQSNDTAHVSIRLLKLHRRRTLIGPAKISILFA